MNQQSYSWKIFFTDTLLERCREALQAQLVSVLFSLLHIQSFLGHAAEQQTRPPPRLSTEAIVLPLLSLSSAAEYTQLLRFPYKLQLVHLCWYLGELVSDSVSSIPTVSFQTFASPALLTFEQGLDTHAVSLACVCICVKERERRRGMETDI